MPETGVRNYYLILLFKNKIGWEALGIYYFKYYIKVILNCTIANSNVPVLVYFISGDLYFSSQKRHSHPSIVKVILNSCL